MKNFEILELSDVKEKIDKIMNTYIPSKYLKKKRVQNEANIFNN
jgi:hypothetical protein